jgi:nitrile hydratase
MLIKVDWKSPPEAAAGAVWAKAEEMNMGSPKIKFGLKQLSPTSFAGEAAIVCGAMIDLKSPGRTGSDPLKPHSGSTQAQPETTRQETAMPAEHDHPHGHDHSHDHEHSTLGEMDLRVRALETLLTQKGYLDPAAVDRIIETYEVHVGPHNGAKVVAKAWADPVFKDWLLKDATAAIASMDYTGRQGEHMVAVPNTPDTHNMVVCTLCSCYPWPVLGLPPVWYKSAAYRSRAVIEPRAVLADFGVTLPEGQNIRVWDSTAEVRYLVLPERPAGTEGWSQEQLATLVTRDAMIGTGLALNPKGKEVAA